MLALLITQFLPFWPCKDCEECADGVASISDYIWFPSHHKSVTTFMQGIYGKDFAIGDIALFPVLILASSVLTIVFCTLKAHKSLMALIPFIGGISGVVGYLITPALQAGPNWIIALVLAALVLLCSMVALSQPIVNHVLKKKAEANK